jgi:hypothetical protein
VAAERDHDDQNLGDTEKVREREAGRIANGQPGDGPSRHAPGYRRRTTSSSGDAIPTPDQPRHMEKVAPSAIVSTVGEYTALVTLI